MSNVDYSSKEVARSYAGGRYLSEEILNGWHDAVSRFVPRRTDERVLDVGAGTGIFARAWSAWRGCQVVALEPSAAMRSEMISAGVPDRVQIVAGHGERLPLRTGSMTVAWLSTVVHHLASFEACARELHRVLGRDGVVLFRGLFADSMAPPAFRFLPGWQRAVARYPSSAKIRAVLRGSRFRFLGRVEVADMGPSTVGEAAEWISRMRSADSFLGRFTDEDIASGLAAMDTHDPLEPIDPSPLTLIAFAAS